MGLKHSHYQNLQFKHLGRVDINDDQYSLKIGVSNGLGVHKADHYSKNEVKTTREL